MKVDDEATFPQGTGRKLIVYKMFKFPICIQFAAFVRGRFKIIPLHRYFAIIIHAIILCTNAITFENTSRLHI